MIIVVKFVFVDNYILECVYFVCVLDLIIFLYIKRYRFFGKNCVNIGSWFGKSYLWVFRSKKMILCVFIYGFELYVLFVVFLKKVLV